MNKWPLLSIVLVVALLASATFWFGVTPKTSLVGTDSLSSTPNFFVQGITVSQYNEKGELAEQIKAKEYKHYENRSIALLTFPEITKSQSGNTWQISAKKGSITNENNNLTFEGKVQAIKNKGLDNEITLSADKMEYFDKHKTLIGLGNTSIVSARETIQADKITLFINTNILNIEGSVRGTYDTHD